MTKSKKQAKAELVLDTMKNLREFCGGEIIFCDENRVPISATSKEGHVVLDTSGDKSAGAQIKFVLIDGEPVDVDSVKVKCAYGDCSCDMSIRQARMIDGYDIIVCPSDRFATRGANHAHKLMLQAREDLDTVELFHRGLISRLYHQSQKTQVRALLKGQGMDRATFLEKFRAIKPNWELGTGYKVDVRSIEVDREKLHKVAAKVAACGQVLEPKDEDKDAYFLVQIGENGSSRMFVLSGTLANVAREVLDGEGVKYYSSPISQGLVFQLEGQRREDEVLQIVTDPSKGFSREQIAEKLGYMLELQEGDPDYKKFWVNVDGKIKLHSGVLACELQEMKMISDGTIFSPEYLDRIKGEKKWDSLFMVRSFIDGTGLLFYLLPKAKAYMAANILASKGKTESVKDRKGKYKDQPTTAWPASQSILFQYRHLVYKRREDHATRAALAQHQVDPAFAARIAKQKEREARWEQSANGKGRVKIRKDRRDANKRMSNLLSEHRS